MSVKIISLELENVKRVALVRMSPGERGLTVIGGANTAGKSSVLDGIMYALGGEKFRPGNLQREGSMADARMRVELSNGIVVERKGKNAALKVSDPAGSRAGQKLLDEFIEELALNLPRFLSMRDDEKAEVLLRTLGISDRLHALDLRENAAYEERHDFGVIVDQKTKFAREMPEYHDVPEVPVSVADMIRESQEILGRNMENDRLRRELADLKSNRERIHQRMTELAAQLEEATRELERVDADIAKAESEPVPENRSTAELEDKISDAENINAKVRANADKAKAEADAEEYCQKYQGLTTVLEGIREERRMLLDGADMPLPELTIGRNERNRPVLLYRNQPWDCMSGMERIRVAVAVIRKLKPACGFVLLDGLEAFDPGQLAELGEYLETNDLQAIATRVSTGDECSIIIEDGVAVQDGVEAVPTVAEILNQSEINLSHSERTSW